MENVSHSDVICMLLTCLSHSQALDTAESNGHSTQGSTFDSDRVLKLIPEWARSVQNWSPLIGPLLDKMFLEPSNAIMVRFLSCISEYLADASELVLLHVLSHMKEQDKMDKGFMSSSDTKSSVDKTKLEKSLFDHLCPLLILRLLPQRVFDDIDSSTIYGKFLSGVNDYQDIKFEDFQCIAAFILERLFYSQ